MQMWTACIDIAGLARSVEDAALILDAMVTGAPRFQKAATEPRPMRFGLLTDWVALACPEIRTNMERVAKMFAGAGAEVKELKIPVDIEMIKGTQWTLLQAEALELHRDLFAREKQHYAPRMRAMIEVAHTLPAWAYLKAERLRRRIRAAVDASFDEVDCLLSPVSPDLPPLISEGTTGDFSFLSAWSLLGLPAFSVPAGLTAGGLPLAIQLATRLDHDERAIQIAAWSESVLGRLPSPPL